MWRYLPGKSRAEPGTLKVLISLGETLVPGLSPNEPLTRLSEGLVYDDSLLAFWGSWGDETKTVRLFCRMDGEESRRDFCNNVGNFTGGNGDPNNICDDDPDTPCYQEKEVPVNQGITFAMMIQILHANKRRKSP
jgi:hypothetical protein